MSHRALLAAIAVFLASLPAPAAAQQYPSKSVRMIVPFGAGGPADVFGRVIAQHLSDVRSRWAGRCVRARDRAASFGTAQTELCDREPAGRGRHHHFAAVVPINYSDLLMVAHPSVGAKTLKEFIALAQAKPGQLNYASSGPGTPYHMAGELFKAMSGTDIVHVSHKTSGDMRSSVIGGHVQMMFDAITVMAQGVRAGQLIGLGTTGAKRSAVMPEMPTLAEAGVPGYEATIWIGLMAPAATPKPIVDLINADVIKIMERADVKEAWAKQGAVPMPMSPPEFDKYLRADIEKWAGVVKVSGAKAE